MKTIILSSLLSVAFFFVASYVLAKDLKNVQVRLSTTINSDCGISSNDFEVKGCYLGTNPRQIFIDANVSPESLPYVLAYTIGEYFLDGTPTDILNANFSSFGQAARQFASWMTGNEISQGQIQFFSQILSK